MAEFNYQLDLITRLDVLQKSTWVEYQRILGYPFELGTSWKRLNTRLFREVENTDFGNVLGSRESLLRLLSIHLILLPPDITDTIDAIEDHRDRFKSIFSIVEANEEYLQEVVWRAITLYTLDVQYLKRGVGCLVALAEYRNWEL